MTLNTTVVKELNLEGNESNVDFHIHDLVNAASKVIVPLGPITSFAARNPWAGLEEQSFEQVARRLKETNGVEIYPSDEVLKSAWKQGEIKQEFVEMKLHQWLDLQTLDLPHDEAFQFCQAALLQNKTSFHSPSKTDLESVMKEILQYNFNIPQNHYVQTYSERLGKMDGNKVNQVVNGQMIKWCKLYLDESQAVWSMPNREKGFYAAWKKLVPNDPSINRTIRKELKELPMEADQALMAALLGLQIPYTEIQQYLEAHLLALPGWAGMMLWRSQQSNKEENLLTEFLAVRICMEYAFIKRYLPLPEFQDDGEELLQSLIISWTNWGNMPIDTWLSLSLKEIEARLTLAYRFDPMVRNRILLEAWEQTYEVQLMNIIGTSSHRITEKLKQPLAQFAFCIDVRSEPFRRKLEEAGPFETFGTAGFFGLPIETCELGQKHSHPSLPILFKPQIKVNECASEQDLKIYQERQQSVNLLNYSFKTLKNSLPSSLLLPEITGPWYSLQTIARSFFPRSTGMFSRKLRKNWLRKPSTELTLQQVQTNKTELPIGFSEEEQVLYARQALNMMGLTENFAPLVVICGHGSHSTNNPYASALDCGACGGASSGFNARVLATLCNLPEVRKALNEEGISIPNETVFAAAEHITTTDELQLLYVPHLSEKAQEALDFIGTTLPKVSEQAVAERLVKLPNLKANHKNLNAQAQRLGEDWSEVRPEWGLARNATFIIGNRELTKNRHLDGRAFLHSYDWQKDPNGSILENIIAGPTTVTQWINLQYYASTVAPHYYGSGNKTTQTVTAGIGVMQGNASDLLSGLPWQSVMKSDQELYHEPLRLLVVIEAPTEYVQRLLDRNQSFHQKVKNGWIRLASIDPEGHWESWTV